MVYVRLVGSCWQYTAVCLPVIFRVQHPSCGLLCRSRGDLRHYHRRCRSCPGHPCLQCCFGHLLCGLRRYGAHCSYPLRHLVVFRVTSMILTGELYFIYLADVRTEFSMYQLPLHNRRLRAGGSREGHPPVSRTSRLVLLRPSRSRLCQDELLVRPSRPTCIHVSLEMNVVYLPLPSAKILIVG